MYKLVVILQVRDFSALQTFEQLAASRMALYGGAIVNALETRREHDGSGEEIHLLQFPDEGAYRQYCSDGVMADNGILRSCAIGATRVIPVLNEKQY